MAHLKPYPASPQRLTPLQEKFIIEYVKEIGDANEQNRRPSAKGAAIRAGYSAKSAHTIAGSLIRDERIKSHIDAEIQHILGASREAMRFKLISRLQVTAFSDVGLFLDENSDVLPKSQWPKGASVMVKDVVNVPTPNGGMRTEIKMKDDKQSQELLVKLLTLVEEMPKKVKMDVSMMTPEQQDERLRELLEKME